MDQILAVERAEPGDEQTVHVLRDGDFKGMGFSYCDFPQEYLTPIPDLMWSAVTANDRCRFCAEEIG
jgi:hypothetical protein